MKIFNQPKVALALSLLVGWGMASCSDIAPLDVDDIAQAQLLERDQKKWAEEAATLAQNRADSARIAEENERLYQVYLQDLRAYKKSDHPVMFGWFAYWNPESPDLTFSLDHLPDSVDFVSNWGASWNLNDIKKEQLARLQNKGTRMTVGWIIEGVGNGLQNAPEGGWSNSPYVAIEQYARAIADSIEKYGYDGLDFDYEPSFRSPFKNGMHCGDPQNWTVGMPESEWAVSRPIISCQQSSNKEYENFFFTKLREFIPAHKMLNINGSIHYLDASVLDKFNYFVYQSYNNTARNWTATTTSTIARARAAGITITPKQFIYTETFQNAENNAKNFDTNYAAVAKSGAGGIGAFHINEDYLYSKYANLKRTIQAVNPAMDN